MSGKAAEGEPGWTLFFGGVIVVFLSLFLWYVFRGPILEGLRYLRLGEAWLVTPFGG